VTRIRSAALAAATLTALALAPLPVAADESPAPVFAFAGRYANGGAEVSAVLGDKLFVIGAGTTLDVVDIADPAQPVLLRTVDLARYGASITSVATSSSGVGAARVAVTLPAADKTAPGTVVLLTPGGSPLRSAPVGANPDMVTFDESGLRVLVANEGEPDSYAPKDDAEGSVSVVNVAALLTKKAGSAVTTIGFADFNVGASRHGELPAGTRVFGPGATVAEDLEPEYITVDGDRAYVTLQENNSIAELDLATNTVVAIRALALKDHSLPGNGLDASDRDSAINIRNWPILGAPLPDGIASYTIDGETYLITANEGDARADWPGYSEEVRFADLAPLLDPAVFTPEQIAQLRGNAALGRLTFTRASGDADGDGLYEQLVAFGTRSASIWTTDGALVGDTGDDLERRPRWPSRATSTPPTTRTTSTTAATTRAPNPRASRWARSTGAATPSSPSSVPVGSPSSTSPIRRHRLSCSTSRAVTSRPTRRHRRPTRALRSSASSPRPTRPPAFRS
jgi:hypothetical protein